jgi:hypothetical protein
VTRFLPTFRRRRRFNFLVLLRAAIDIQLLLLSSHRALHIRSDRLTNKEYNVLRFVRASVDSQSGGCITQLLYSL